MKEEEKVNHEAEKIVMWAKQASARMNISDIEDELSEMPTIELDPLTISMMFGVNDSPLAGRDGTHLTGGKIGDRLLAEAETNLAINVIPGLQESYAVQGRGELQLGILIENMKLTCDSSLEAEIWGIYKGLLTIILEKGMTNMKIESDALIVVTLINDGQDTNHPLSSIINDANTILAGTNSSL